VLRVSQFFLHLQHDISSIYCCFVAGVFLSLFTLVVVVFDAVAILDECNLRSDEVQDETRCNLCDKTIDEENYDLCTSCNNTYHLTCMETKAYFDHKRP
jgi:hypothetical protein